MDVDVDLGFMTVSSLMRVVVSYFLLKICLISRRNKTLCERSLVFSSMLLMIINGSSTIGSTSQKSMFLFETPIRFLCRYRVPFTNCLW